MIELADDVASSNQVMFVGSLDAAPSHERRQTIVTSGVGDKVICDVALLTNKYYGSTPAVERIKVLLRNFDNQADGLLRVWIPHTGAEDILTDRVLRMVAASGVDQLPAPRVTLLFSNKNLDLGSPSPEKVADCLLIKLDQFVASDGSLDEIVLLSLFSAMGDVIKTGDSPVSVARKFGRDQSRNKLLSIFMLKPSISGIGIDLHEMIKALRAASKRR